MEGAVSKLTARTSSSSIISSESPAAESGSVIKEFSAMENIH